ncbi:MAG TPA: hypothetical protein VGQ94_08205, partial [Terriglobales bacterium]|nr:hypothetical protein [Terriglobales bacterium]
MRPRKNLVYLLSLGLLLLAMAATYGCGGSNNALFPGGSAAQGAWSGTSSASSGAGGTSATWNLTVDHTANTFSAQNVTLGKNYSGTISTPPSLFLENVTTTSNDSSLTLPATGHSVEIPDTVILLHLDDNSQNVTPL